MPAEKKLLKGTYAVKKSKKGNYYLSYTTKKGKTLFVNLIKDNKKFIPSIPEGAIEVEISFSGYKYGDNNITLFGVTDMSYLKGVKL